MENVTFMNMSNVPAVSIYAACFVFIALVFLYIFDFLKNAPISNYEINLRKQRSASFILFIFFSMIFIFLVSSVFSLDYHYYFYASLILIAALYFSWKFKDVDVALFVLTLAVGGINYNAWYWADIGDEAPHIEASIRLINEFWINPLANLFSMQGVYDSHPKFSTLLQGFIGQMGTNPFIASRFSNVIFWAITTVVLRNILIRFVSNYISILISILFATSGFFLAFSKIGYNNLQAICLNVWAFYLILKCLKNPVAKNGILLGLVTGLLFYSFPPAIFFLPVAIFSFFIHKKYKLLLPFVVAWLSISLPALIQIPKYTRHLFVTGQLHERSYDYVAMINSYLSKIILMFAIPISNIQHSHFIHTGIINPVLGFMGVLGFAYVLRRSKEHAHYGVLALYFAVMIVTCCLVNGYSNIPMTRIFLFLPPLYICAAIFLDRVFSNYRKLLFVFSFGVLFANFYSGLFLPINPKSESPREYQDWKAQLIRFEQLNWKKEFKNSQRDQQIGFVIISKELQVGGREIEYLQSQFMPEVGFYYRFLTPENDQVLIENILNDGKAPVFFLAIDPIRQQYASTFQSKNFKECVMKTTSGKHERLFAFLPPHNLSYHCPN